MDIVFVSLDTQKINISIVNKLNVVKTLNVILVMILKTNVISVKELLIKEILMIVVVIWDILIKMEFAQNYVILT